MEIYIKDDCPYCAKQLSVLESKGAEYTVYNVSDDPGALKRVKEEFKADQVPVLVEKGKVKNIGFGGGG